MLFVNHNMLWMVSITPLQVHVLMNHNLALIVKSKEVAELGGQQTTDRGLKHFLPVCLCSSEPVFKTLDMENTGSEITQGLRGGSERRSGPDNV